MLRELTDFAIAVRVVPTMVRGWGPKYERLGPAARLR